MNLPALKIYHTMCIVCQLKQTFFVYSVHNLSSELGFLSLSISDIYIIGAPDEVNR